MPNLVPCPHCACHIHERSCVCPHCDATLRVCGGPRKTAAAALLGLAVASGCYTETPKYGMATYQTVPTETDTDADADSDTDADADVDADTDTDSGLTTSTGDTGY